jgi:uncharacterized membrane protein HdeD (DUF308 family)
MFERFLKRASWADLLISVVFIIFGALLIAKPTEIMSMISILLGMIFVIMGFLKLMDYFTSKDKEDYLLTMALIAVVFGVVILFCSDLISAIFRIILGVWIIGSGIMNFQTSLAWKQVKSGYWTTTVICAMLMIIAGIVILVSNTLAVQMVGTIIIIYAVLDLVTRGIFIKKVKNYLDLDD